jgi:K+-sensing histidine kinase KdpD
MSHDDLPTPLSLSPFPVKAIASKTPPEAGTVYETPHVCIRHYSKIGCQKFYESLEVEGPFKTYRCPVGFLVVVVNVEGQKLAVSGMVDEPSHLRSDLKKVTRSNRISKGTVTNWLRKMAAIRAKDRTVQERLIQEKVKEALGPFHDIKRIIGSITSNAALLAKRQHPELASREAIEVAEPELKAIYKSAEIMDLIGTSLDSLTNPELLTSGKRRQRGIFDSFHKAIQILDGKAKASGVRFEVTGSSYDCAMLHGHFDVLPFVLIDNAVKYCLPGEVVSIQFQEYSGNVSVTISNPSYLVPDEDLKKAFMCFHRGRFARQRAADGSGIGLYVARQITDGHGISIKLNFTPTSGKFHNQISLGIFSVELGFKNTFRSKNRPLD